MSEDGVDHGFFRWPGEEVCQAKAVCQSPDNPRQRTCGAWSREGLLHEVQMGIGHFAAKFLQPRRARQDNVREATRGVVHEQVMTDHQTHMRQTSGQRIRVGKRRDKVGTEEEKYLHAAGQEGFGHACHLARNVVTRWTPMVSRNICQCLAMGGRAVTRPKTTTWDAQIAREGWQTRNGSSCLPTIGPLVH